MKSLKSAPIVILSVLLAGSTALSSNTFAACSSCGQQRANQKQVVTIKAPQQTIFSDNRPRVTVTSRRNIIGSIDSADDSHDLRKSASGPIFGDDDCARNRRPIFGEDDCSYANSGPMLGPNTCTKRKCGGAMFGPQTCAKPDLPCGSCKTAPKPVTPRRAFIQNYKIIPDNTPFERIHKCSELAPFQLEWVDFRINDGNSESFSKKLGNYRFRLFGCRRFSKKAMLNEGRIIQKDMQFIDIFEDLVEDCYNIIKVPNDLCLRDQDYEAPEYILTAEITDYFMNVCDGYDWDNAEKADKRTGSAEMTVTWRLLDLTKTKVLWKGETTGYSELEEGSYDGEIDLIERAFADATLNLKGLPEFENQLAIRVPRDVLEQQKTTLLAIEQASDPVKCRLEVPQATSCPIPESFETDPTTIETIQYIQPQQCNMPAEIIEYIPVQEQPAVLETIPLEQTGTYVPYADNICYGQPTQELLPVNEPPLMTYLEPEENACENPLFGQENQDCDPSLLSFLKADELPQQIEQIFDPEPQECLRIPEPETSGGISKDSGYYMPETEELTPVNDVRPTADWKPYEEETEHRQPESIIEDGGSETVSENSGITESGLSEIETLPPCPSGETTPSTVDVTLSDGTVVKKPTCQIIEEGNYKTADHFCIENVAPYPDMRPENLYRVRASMLSVRSTDKRQSAGLLIADDLILTSADAVDENVTWYDVETINGVKAKAKVVRINVKKNIALLQTDQKMYFRPLSLNMELPPVGSTGYMSLGLLNNSEGENYLDDKGRIKGYRFTDQMGTEIITDTFVQTVSSGGALIDSKGVVNGIASRNQKFDDKGDLFLPIQDAINSVGLDVCGQSEPFVQVPKAVVKPVSSAIDDYKGSKEPAAMNKGKRK